METCVLVRLNGETDRLEHEKRRNNAGEEAPRGVQGVASRSCVGLREFE